MDISDIFGQIFNFNLETEQENHFFGGDKHGKNGDNPPPKTDDIGDFGMGDEGIFTNTDNQENHFFGGDKHGKNGDNPPPKTDDHRAYGMIDECTFTDDNNGHFSNFDGWGNPLEDADNWHRQENNNSCAVVAQIGIYESITGHKISEAEAVKFAEEQHFYDPEIGTYSEDIGKFLELNGIDTEQKYDGTLDDIIAALERGDKVIAGLDANEIWYPEIDPKTGLPLEQIDAGHAVWITGIDTKPDGSIKIILNDSGTSDGQMKVVDYEDFINAWNDYGNFMVVADAPNKPVWS